VTSDQNRRANFVASTLVWAVEGEPHLGDLAHERRDEAQQRQQPERHGAHLQLAAERLGTETQDLARGAGRRAGHVPGLAVGIVRGIEQRDHGARDIGDIGEVVGRIGRGEQQSRLASRERAESRRAEMRGAHARAVEVRRPQGRDASPSGGRRGHPDARDFRPDRRLRAEIREGHVLAERLTLRPEHVQAIDEHHAGSGRGAGFDEVGHGSRPGAAPDPGVVGKADRHNDLPGSGDRLTDGFRIEHVAGLESGLGR